MSKSFAEFYPAWETQITNRLSPEECYFLPSNSIQAEIIVSSVPRLQTYRDSSSFGEALKSLYPESLLVREHVTLKPELLFFGAN